MRQKKEILNNLHHDQWSQHTVNAVIAAKAEKRAIKGLSLNCYSLDFNRKDELNASLNLIYDKVTKLKDKETLRFQLAVKVREHWTAVDIELSNNSVNMLHVDAASDYNGFKAARSLFEKLVEKYPNQHNVEQFKFFQLEQDMNNSNQIQLDSSNCSRFTLDHLFHLANLDTFTLLEACEHTSKPLKQFGYDKFVRAFNPTNMPVEFALLYRNSQSKKKFSALPEEIKSQIINKKGQTLAQSEAFHTRDVESNQNIKPRNQAIFNKKTNFIEEVQKFLLQDNRCLEINNRSLFKSLDSKLFLNKKSFLKTSNEFKELIKSSTSSDLPEENSNKNSI